MICEVIAQTVSEASTHIHSTKVAKRGDYVELSARGLDKKLAH